MSNVSVFVDDVLKGNAVYGSSRPDVAMVWPHAPAQCGWTFSLDSTQLTNGVYTMTIHAKDTSNNEAILGPISLTVSNKPPVQPVATESKGSHPEPAFN